MLEKIIEAAVCDYAKKQGVIQVKLNSAIGLPDRCFFYKERYLLVEFKAPKKKTSGNQNLIRELWKESGVQIHVLDSIELGMNLIDGLISDE